MKTEKQINKENLLKEIESFIIKQLSYCNKQESNLYEANSKKTEGDEYTDDINTIKQLQNSLLEDKLTLKREKGNWITARKRVSMGALVILETQQGQMIIFISSLKHTPQLKIDGIRVCFTGVQAPLIQILLNKKEGEEFKLGRIQKIL